MTSPKKPEPTTPEPTTPEPTVLAVNLEVPVTIVNILAQAMRWLYANETQDAVDDFDAIELGIRTWFSKQIVNHELREDQKAISDTLDELQSKLDRNRDKATERLENLVSQIKTRRERQRAPHNDGDNQKSSDVLGSD